MSTSRMRRVGVPGGNEGGGATVEDMWQRARAMYERAREAKELYEAGESERDSPLFIPELAVAYPDKSRAGESEKGTRNLAGPSDLPSV